MYPAEQSPLYKLQTKRQLARLLRLDLSTVVDFTEDTEQNYKVFQLREKKKTRHVQEPKKELKRIHTRIFRLLQRIDLPDYLHSGVKGRSYVSNAAAHTGHRQIFKLDIKSFFPSVASTHIYYFFHDIMQCAPDVAWQLRALCTYGDQLPTGSCISQIIAFYAYKPMFDAIFKLVQDHDLTMTCYVDDLTFSGEIITGKFQYEVKKIIRHSGLVSHKEEFYGHKKTKRVTGVIIDGDHLKVPNKQRWTIHETLKVYNGLPPGKERDKMFHSLVGRCCAAGLVDPRYKRLAKKVLRGKRKTH